jgi:hypothetical protein
MHDYLKFEPHIDKFTVTTMCCRFLIYMKLFATMCGLWITESIMWADQGDDDIWHVFDIINSLRGLWLMIFCVLLSTRVRCKLLRVCGCPGWAAAIPVGDIKVMPDQVPRRETIRVNVFDCQLRNGKDLFSDARCPNKRRTT